MEARVQQFERYFNQLSAAEQDSVLHLLKTITKEKSESEERTSVEQYNAEIEEALAEANRGETLTHEEVEALSKQW